MCFCIFSAWYLVVPEFTLIKWTILGSWKIQLKGLNVRSSSFAGLPGIRDACLGRSLLFSRHTWAVPALGAWPGEPGSSLLCNMQWLEESNNEVSEPLWPPASFLPFIWTLNFSWKRAILDHQCSVLWEQRICKVYNGLTVCVRWTVKFYFSFSSLQVCLWKWRWPSDPCVWLSVWCYSSQTLSGDPCELEERPPH